MQFIRYAKYTYVLVTSCGKEIKNGEKYISVFRYTSIDTNGVVAVQRASKTA